MWVLYADMSMQIAATCRSSYWPLQVTLAPGTCGACDLAPTSLRPYDLKILRKILAPAQTGAASQLQTQLNAALTGLSMLYCSIGRNQPA